MDGQTLKHCCKMSLSNLIKRCTLVAPTIIRRNLYTSVARTSSKAYDHDGKTKINIFNTQQDLGIMITGYSQYGFRMNNDMVVIGPVAVFPRYSNVLYNHLFIHENVIFSKVSFVMECGIYG